jgi:hypothetical protein
MANRTRRNSLPRLHLDYNTHRPQAEVGGNVVVVVVVVVDVEEEDNRATGPADSVDGVVEAAAVAGNSSTVAAADVRDNPNQGSSCSPLLHAIHFFRSARAFAQSSI